MASNSSPFGSENGKKNSRTQLLRDCSGSVRVAGLAASILIAGEHEIDFIAREAGTALGGFAHDSGDPGWRDVVARWVFARDRAESLAQTRAASSLTVVWAKLSPKVRSEIRDFVWETVKRTGLVVSDVAAKRVSQVRFAGETGLDGDLIFRTVLDSDPDAARAAEDEVVRSALASHGLAAADVGWRHNFVRDGQASLPNRTQLAAGVARLCGGYLDHRRRGVLLAAMVLLDSSETAFGGGAIGRWFANPKSESLPALRTFLKKATGALARQRAWEWLASPAVAAACIERLTNVDSDREHEAVLERGHLALNPDRAERLLLVSPTKRGTSPLVPGADATGRLSAAARRQVPRIVRSFRASATQAEELLSGAIADSDEATRMNAMLAIPPRATLDFCFDSSPSIGRCASVRWMSSLAAEPQERARVAANLSRSPDGRVRWFGEVAAERYVRFGASDAARLEFWKLWRSDRAGCIGELRAAVGQREPELRFRAIMAARRVGLQRELEPEFLSIALPRRSVGERITELEQRVVSAAVAGLGESHSEGAVRSLRLCLNHPVARARATAAESLARALRGRGDLPFAEESLYESMIELKDDGNHRVRSSAILSVLRAAAPMCGGTGFDPVAADALVEMLGDERPMHRVAALWATERVAGVTDAGNSLSRRWDSLASRVADMARADGEEVVRVRAVRCARRMLARMRGGMAKQEAA